MGRLISNKTFGIDQIFVAIRRRSALFGIDGPGLYNHCWICIHTMGPLLQPDNDIFPAIRIRIRDTHIYITNV